jgi:serine/threonine-protein kinase
MGTGAADVVAGRYVLGAVLGRGGMGEVRRAHDERLDRDVAIKLLDRLARETPEALTRFEYEARTAAALVHPNVVRVYDYGEDDAHVYLVMEVLSGRTLGDEIRHGPLAPTRLVEVASDVLAGLSAAHAQNIVHRDIKPGNVLFDERGRAKLADFGVATTDSTLDLTQTGLVLGTPAYVAPERLTGQRATSRSDIYAFGVVCYEALAGEKPFTGDAPLTVARAIERGEVRPLHQLRPDVPRALCDVVMRAMARDPDQRFVSADDFSNALHVAHDGTGDWTVVVEPAEPSTPSAAVTQAVPRLDRTAAMPTTRPSPAAPAPVATPRRRRMAPFVVALLVLAVVGGALLGWYQGRDDDPGPDTQQQAPLDDGPVKDGFERLEELVRR